MDRYVRPPVNREGEAVRLLPNRLWAGGNTQSRLGGSLALPVCTPSKSDSSVKSLLSFANGADGPDGFVTESVVPVSSSAELIREHVLSTWLAVDVRLPVRSLVSVG